MSIENGEFQSKAKARSDLMNVLLFAGSYNCFNRVSFLHTHTRTDYEKKQKKGFGKFRGDTSRKLRVVPSKRKLCHRSNIAPTEFLDLKSELIEVSLFRSFLNK